MSARSVWDSACRAWSRDDCKDETETMKLGEAVMYAATDLIVAQEVLIEELVAAAKHARMCVPFPSDCHAKLVKAIEAAERFA